jgi:hypothetical protein
MNNLVVICKIVHVFLSGEEAIKNSVRKKYKMQLAGRGHCVSM